MVRMTQLTLDCVGITQLHSCPTECKTVSVVNNT